MKKSKDVAEVANAGSAVAAAKPDFSLIDESLLKSRIHTIRGVKVMLDADLAEIYGYETKAFNRQVKNNIDRFPEEFRFPLSREEQENLRCNFDRKLESQKQKPSLRLHRTGHLYAHDCAQRRTGGSSEQGPNSPFQADEGLYCRREHAVVWLGKSANCLLYDSKY